MPDSTSCLVAASVRSDHSTGYSRLMIPDWSLGTCPLFTPTSVPTEHQRSNTADGRASPGP
jgi:hypothetical protein